MKTLKQKAIIVTTLMLLFVGVVAGTVKGETITSEQETTTLSSQDETTVVPEKVQKEKVTNPKGTKIRKYEAGKRYIRIAWNESKEKITGYQIQYSTSKKFKKKKTKLVTVKKASKTSKKLKKLKPGTKYYIRVRTYKVVEGVKYYSKWSKKKTIKTSTGDVVWGSYIGGGGIYSENW